MATIERHGGVVEIDLDETEAEILRDLLREMQRLLEADRAVDDAVIDRLFPSAYAAPDDAKAFAELVGDELKSGKNAAVVKLLEFLGERGAARGTVGTQDLDAWLTALTDVRLALGTRLEVTEDKMAAELDPADPDSVGMSIMHWLGWVQESLLREMATRGER